MDESTGTVSVTKIKSYNLIKETADAYEFASDNSDGKEPVQTLKYPKLAVKGSKFTLPRYTQVLMDDEWINIQLVDNDGIIDDDEYVPEDSGLWSEPATKFLIQQYKVMKPLVDADKIPSQNKMFALMEDKFRENGYPHTGDQLKGKWRCLLRSYKKTVLKDRFQKNSSGCKYKELIEDAMGNQPISVLLPVKKTLTSVKSLKTPSISVGVTSDTESDVGEGLDEEEEEETLEEDPLNTARKRRNQTNELWSEIKRLRTELIRFSEEKEQAKAQRHEEKMDLLRKFVNYAVFR